MTNTLKLSAAAVAAMLAFAGVANAEGVRVSVAGKSRGAVRGEIVQAARSVCEDAVSSDLQGQYGSLDECVAATVDATFAKINAPANTLAMAKPSSVQSR